MVPITWVPSAVRQAWAEQTLLVVVYSLHCPLPQMPLEVVPLLSRVSVGFMTVSGVRFEGDGMDGWMDGRLGGLP